MVRPAVSKPRKPTAVVVSMRLRPSTRRTFAALRKRLALTADDLMRYLMDELVVDFTEAEQARRVRRAARGA